MKIAKILTKTAILWLGLSAVPLFYYVHQTNVSHQFLLRNLEEKGKQFLTFVDERAAKIYADNRTNFHRLSQSKLLVDFAQTQDERLKHYLLDQWVSTSANEQLFYQLRFLDNQGYEKLRVDYTPEMIQPRVIPDSELQFKGNRDYFRYAKSLVNGQVGYFGIDLEYEHGKPLIPYQPGFRIIRPVADENGVRLGYFIANLNVMLTIERASENSQNYLVDYVDNEGNYVVSSDPTKLFSKFISQRAKYNVPHSSPELWQAITQARFNSGSLVDEHGIHVFRPFHTRLFETQGGLTLITTIPQQEIQQTLASQDHLIQNDATILFFIMGFVSIALAGIWQRLVEKNLQRTFDKVIAEQAVAVAMTDENHRILRVNARLCQMLGLESSQIRGHQIEDFQVSNSKYQTMVKSLALSGEWDGQLLLKSRESHIVCKVEVRPLSSSLKKVNYYVYSFSDVSAQHRALLEFKEQSEKDPSTTLWNKKKFNQTLVHYARLHARYKNQPESCLAIIDIDNFKHINDTYGHDAGDKVILQLSTQLLSILRDTDFVARIGGDEFAVILQHADTSIALTMMERVCHAVAAWRQYSITVSIGVAAITSNHHQTFLNADKALYRSKRKGKNCVSAHGIEHFRLVPKQS